MSRRPPKPRHHKNPVAVRFAENLVRCRTEAGLTQEALAFRAQVHRTQVSLMESGERLPRFETLLRIFTSLEVRPEVFFEGIVYEPVIENGGRIEVKMEPHGNYG